MTGNGHKIFFPNVKTINAAVKTHMRDAWEANNKFFLAFKTINLLNSV
jgi:hypothetical protein